MNPLSPVPSALVFPAETARLSTTIVAFPREDYFSTKHSKSESSEWRSWATFPLACAAIASLHRGILSACSAKAMTATLLDAALWDRGTDSVCALSAFALAAILNKESDKGVVYECCEIIWDRCDSISPTTSLESKRIVVVGLVGHGMALRGYNFLSQFVQCLIRVITSVPREKSIQQATAKALASIVSGQMSLVDTLWLESQCHFQESVLWQQKAFICCQRSLLSALADLGEQNVNIPEVEGPSSKSFAPLLSIEQCVRLAFLNLVASSPMQICKNSCEDVMEMVANGLATAVEISYGRLYIGNLKTLQGTSASVLNKD